MPSSSVSFRSTNGRCLPRRNAVCAAVALLVAYNAGHALPQDGKPTFGQTTVQTTGTQMTITQGTARAGIDWASFSIGSGEGLTIQQPSSSAVLFNRVTGSDPSQILGNLQANGRVFLSNPRGVIFGQGSVLDVGALVATTLTLGDEAMLADRIELRPGTGTPGRLVQEGRITASGTVALVSPLLEQRGEISAPRIGLAAAERVSVDVEGDGLIFFNVGTDNLDTRLQALGALTADGGLVEMRAQARAGFVDTVLNLDGVVRARSLGSRQGRIVVDGGTVGITDVRGRLDASGVAAGEVGGAVTVLGEKVGLFDQAVVDASGDAGGGTILVGGNYQGQGPERNASALYVDAGVYVRADALGTGNGGRVILWSSESTRFYGALSALGGPSGGDGGFAEVSGKEFLAFEGDAYLASPLGAPGSLLLDPRDVTVVASAGGGLPANPFVPNADNTVIGWDQIDAALGANTDVQITTGTTGTQAGNITISEASGNLNTNGNLTFTAAGSILINAAIQNSGNGKLILDAGVGITTTGSISMGANGSDVTITAGSSGVSFGASVSVPNGSLTISSAGLIQQVGGTITVGDAATFIATAENVDLLLAGFDNDFNSPVTITAINGGSLRDVGLRNVDNSATLP
ncbi:MAG: filamentous hemagglutinin N-terminal domain-containing protein, partial [Rubrivivax sp.]|nr:filamentous hemagglutinin N-terminal domain-containing protein [Rubrivivax sp.]